MGPQGGRVWGELWHTLWSGLWDRRGGGCGASSGAWKGLPGGSMKPLLLQQLPPQHRPTEMLPQAEFNIISLCPEKEQPFLSVT